MDTKTAAQNSLYIILFSQLASILFTLVTGTAPEFEWYYLVVMVCGGMLGRLCNKRMDNRAVEKLFIALMCLIIIICVFNAYQYAKL